MATSLVWYDLGPEQLINLEPVLDYDDARVMLAKDLDIIDLDESETSKILMDFFVNALKFARDSYFTPEKSSAFFSILKRIHTQSTDVSTPMQKSFALFKDLLMKHSVQRPPYSVGVFELSEVKLITDYVVNNYYRHYKLYQHAFTRKETLEFTQRTSFAEIAPKFLPLCEAVVDKDTLEEEEEESEEDEPEPVPDSKLPLKADAIEDTILSQVDEQVSYMREELQQSWKTREDELLARIAELEELAEAKLGGKKK